MSDISPVDPSACSILIGISSSAAARMAKLNRKLGALRRLSELLEDALDPRDLIPYLPSLIPLSQIDITAYNNLRQACPFLNLPDGQAGIAALQAEVFKAYMKLIDLVTLHPWAKLRHLQSHLDRLQAKMNLGLFSDLRKYLLCAQGACVALGEAADSMRENQKVFTDFQVNFIDNTAGVLNERMKDKLEIVEEMSTTLVTLTADPPQG